MRVIVNTRDCQPSDSRLTVTDISGGDVVAAARERGVPVTAVWPDDSPTN